MKNSRSRKKRTTLSPARKTSQHAVAHTRVDQTAPAPASAPIDERIGTFVRLRPIRVKDAEITLRWRQTERAALLTRGAQTIAEQAAWIAARPASEQNFVIELRSTGQPVGMLSLTAIDLVHRCAEPGRFLIGEPEAVRGIPAAVEAMKLLYELAFDRLGLIRLYGTIAADNTLMLKWQKYLGMKEEGRLRSHYFMNDGKYHDAVCLRLLVDEYRAVTLARMRALIAAARPAPTRSAASAECP